MAPSHGLRLLDQCAPTVCSGVHSLSILGRSAEPGTARILSQLPPARSGHLPSPQYAAACGSLPHEKAPSSTDPWNLPNHLEPHPAANAERLWRITCHAVSLCSCSGGASIPFASAWGTSTLPSNYLCHLFSWDVFLLRYPSSALQLFCFIIISHVSVYTLANNWTELLCSSLPPQLPQQSP